MSNEREPDIAILELEDEAPRCASVGKLAIKYDFWNLELKVCGFSSGMKGEWVSVVGRGRSYRNYIQIDISPDAAYKIEGGFSGTPVFDAKLNNIVGMVVYKEKATGILSGGFIPIVLILNLCKEHSFDLKIFGKNIPDLFGAQFPSYVTVLEHGISCLSNTENRKRLNCIVSELDSLNENVGQLFIREIKAAFESLADAYLTTNRDTKNNRLSFAEKQFLKNSHLGINVTFCNYSSLDLMAFSHYGLSIICHFQNDDTISLRHILQAYKLSPRLLRTKLSPEFYDAYLCTEVVKRVNLWEKNELDSINNKNYAGKEAILKKGAALGFVAGTTLLLTGLTTPASQIIMVCDKTWRESDSSHLKAEAIRVLKTKIEDKTNELCGVMANELLTELEQSSTGEYLLE